MKVDVYNPTDQPVVLDPDGHTVGGREHATVDDRHDEVTSAVDGGRLIVVDKAEKAPKSSKSKKRNSDTSSGEPQADEHEES